MKLWDFSTGRPLATLDEHGEDRVEQILFSPDAKTVITLSFKSVRVWDLE